LLIFLAFIPLAALSQEYYRWVDADGVSHFSQNPPPEGVLAEQALLPRNMPTTEVTVEQNVAESEGDQETLNSFGKDPELCTEVLQSLQTMNQYDNIVMTDPETGNGVYLSETERAAERVRLENMRSYYCD